MILFNTDTSARMIRCNFIFACTIILASFFPTVLKSTHVAGGDLYYECLGNGQYRIILEFRRDCFNGAVNAQFDNPASLGIYSIDGVLQTQLGQIGQIQIPFAESDTLNEVLTSECRVEGEDVCIHRTTYIDTVFLPPNADGYIISYQRCCRNSSLSNIIDPLLTGSTYWAHITPRAMEFCNSSPQFNAWPPIYFCANELTTIDHAATDIDGDSLVYRLCLPSAGATETSPNPQPSGPPPYETVTYLPPFSETNMMGSANLAIDPNTGQITVTPAIVGQFLVGVCVEEYRDGELLSTIRRDFEVNVRICIESVAANFEVDANPNCSSLEVNFDNNSENGTSFDWFFDWPNMNITSNDPNPTHVYPAPGLYEVVLAVTDGECTDTMRMNVGVSLPLDPEADFDFAVNSCTDSLELQFMDNTTTSQMIMSYNWVIDDGTNMYMATGANPAIMISGNGGMITSTLTVMSESGCAAEITKTFEANLSTFEIVSDNIQLCQGGVTNLIQNANPAFTYTWSPTTGLDLTDPANPIANPSSSTLYAVTVTDGLCTVIEEIMVNVDQSFDIEFLGSGNAIEICDGESTSLVVNGNSMYNYEWSPTTGLNLSDPSNPIATPTINTTYTVTVTNGICEETAEISVNVNESREIEIIGSETACNGLVSLQARVTDNETVEWFSDAALTQSLGTSNPISIPITGGATIYVTSMLTECGGLGSITIMESNIGVDLDLSGRPSICISESLSITAQPIPSNQTYIYTWSPSNYIVSGQGTATPVFNFLTAGAYSIMATIEDPFGCTASESITIDVEDVPMLSLDTEISICENSTIELNPNFNAAYSYNWTSNPPGLISNPTAVNPSVTPTQDAEVFVTISLPGNQQCSISESINIEVTNDPVFDISATKTVVCTGESSRLSVSAGTGFTIEWKDQQGNIISMNNVVDVSPNGTATYFVELRNGIGCSAESSIVINTAADIVLDVNGYDAFYCEGEPVSLTAITNVPTDIQWSDENGNIISNDPTYTFVPIGATTVGATAIDQNGCQVSESFDLSPHTFDGRLINADILCKDQESNISIADLDPNVSYTFRWDVDGSITSGLDQQVVTIMPTQNTDYTVVIEDSNGCSWELSTFIEISDIGDNITIDISGQDLLPGESVQLEVEDNPNYRYSWSPAELFDDPTIHNPIAFPVDGVTIFEVTITNEFECSVTNEVVIRLLDAQCDITDVFVPNMFTPNGDGMNDFFDVESNYIEELELIVYNRWGEKVFESNSQDLSWDGTHNDQDVDPDVYGYWLRVVCVNGEEYSTKGNVTVVK